MANRMTFQYYVTGVLPNLDYFLFFKVNFKHFWVILEASFPRWDTSVNVTPFVVLDSGNKNNDLSL